MTPPAGLGRGAIVDAGAPAPAGVAEAPRLRVDADALAAPGGLVERLHRAWVSREPVVVELAVDVGDLLVEERYDGPVHLLDPDFLFPIERLRHLVWANNADHRRTPARWWHAAKAAQAIAGAVEGGPADLLLPDGTAAWIDGGPRQRSCELLAAEADRRCGCAASARSGVVLLHRDDTERGIVSPLRCPKAADPLAELAVDQRAAATASLGAVRVAAPAGSGKTRVLTARLDEILRRRGTPPQAVLALAYNTQAAAELRERSSGGTARTATVHSYAFEILRRHSHHELTVLDERAVRGLLSGIVDVPRRTNTDPLQPYIDALDRIRIALVAPEVVEREREDVHDLEIVVLRYREQLRRRRAVDFPEMVHAAIELLLRDPAVRAAEQRRVGQILVDEFQDLTPAYLLFIRLLASPQLQCFGVGDDDQVIYGHSGADPRFLLSFPDLFPGAEDHPLEVNYRCPAPVVTAATRLLSRNHLRLDKTVRAADTAEAAEIDVQLVPAAEQARAAGTAVEKALAGGADPQDVAVLARVRVSLLGTQAELATRGIGCTSPIGEWLLHRTGVRAALAYLRLGLNEEMAAADLAEVLHRPLRTIPGSFRERLRGRASWTPRTLTALADSSLRGRSRRALQRLLEDLSLLRSRCARQPTAEALRHIRDVIGLGDAMRSLDASAGDDVGSSHIDDLTALVQVADHCPDPREFQSFLTDVVTQPPPDGPAVTLSTVHRVKGLEWPHVIIVDASEGIVPHQLARGADALEEERRIFHVAMTRAAHRLTIVAPRTGTSRFVAELTGAPTPLSPSAAPRPRVGTVSRPPARPPRRAARPASGGLAAGRYRATVGLALRASGGLEGTVEQVDDAGVLVRTPRGSLLRLRYGAEIRVDGRFGTLVRA